MISSMNANVCNSYEFKNVHNDRTNKLTGKIESKSNFISKSNCKMIGKTCKALNDKSKDVELRKGRLSALIFLKSSPLYRERKK